jgi:hypothetical protein
MIADLSHMEKDWSGKGQHHHEDRIDLRPITSVVNNLIRSTCSSFFSLLHHHSGSNDKNDSLFNKDG